MFRSKSSTGRHQQGHPWLQVAMGAVEAASSVKIYRKASAYNFWMTQSGVDFGIPTVQDFLLEPNFVVTLQRFRL